MALAESLEREAQLDDRRAGSLDEVAVELGAEAATLSTALDTVARRFRADVWIGPAADRAREEAAAGTRRMRAAADDLARVAALLRRRAGGHRSRAETLRRQADAARAGGPPAPPPAR